MGATGKKQAVFEAVAVMGKALASPLRLELLDLLAQAPRTVDELAELSGQCVANASQHLQALHGAGLVERERAGNHVRYAISRRAALRVGWRSPKPPPRSSPRSNALPATTSATTSRRSGEWSWSNGFAGAMSSSSTCARRRSSSAGHIDGARSIPIDELERRIDELPAEAEVVAYCRGPFCAYASAAVRQLQSRGRRARRLKDGWPEWSLANANEKATSG